MILGVKVFFILFWFEQGDPESMSPAPATALKFFAFQIYFNIFVFIESSCIKMLFYALNRLLKMLLLTCIDCFFPSL